MNKEQYLAELRAKLKRLPSTEVNNALAYYDEYLNDAGPEHEQETIEALGTPAEVAATIIGDYAIKDVQDETGKQSAKRGLSSIWIVILGLLVSPLALPLALALIVILIALLITVFALMFSLFSSAIAIALTGLVGFVAGAISIFQSVSTGLFYIGAGLVMAALGIALFMATLQLLRLCIRGIALLGAKLLKKRGA